MARILVIEDDIAIAELERDYLEVDGHEVVIEANGKRGLTLALSDSFDLVVLDVMLPGMDGMEVCRTLRKSSDIPILMVTARTSDIDAIRGLGLGADDYVKKPFSPSELVARVNAHLARYERLRGGVGEVVGAGDITIDTATRSVMVGDKAVDLRTREYDILLFLARNPNVVFSRDSLYEHVWGLDGAGDASTVTVHIKRLRDKIEPDPHEPTYLETVRGAGYRLRVL